MPQLIADSGCLIVFGNARGVQRSGIEVSGVDREQMGGSSVPEMRLSGLLPVGAWGMDRAASAAAAREVGFFKNDLIPK